MSLRHLLAGALAGLTIVLGACGGSDDAPPAAAPARIEVTPATALMTRPGQSVALQAQVFDADGKPMSGVSVTWQSTTPEQISIDATGLATAKVAAGSARISASVGALRAKPVDLLVGGLNPGVLALASEVLAGPIRPISAAGTAAYSFELEVDLVGVTAPAPGDVFVTTGNPAIAGIVVASTDLGSGRSRVRFTPAPLAAVFSDFSYRQPLDLDAAMLAPGVDANFSVQRDGSTWTFTPKTTTQNLVAPSGRAQALRERRAEVEVLGFKCEGDLGSVLSVPTPITLSLGGEPKVEIVREAGEFKRFVVSGEAKVGFTPMLQIQPTVGLKVDCKRKLLSIPFLSNGVFGGDVPLSVGFEAGLKASVATGVTVGAEFSLSQPFEIGLECAPDCGPFLRRSGSFEVKADPKVVAPNAIDGKVDLGFAPYVSAGAEFGISVLQLAGIDFASLDVLEARLGAAAESSFAPAAAQVNDKDYKSAYGVGLALTVGLAQKSEEELGKVLKLFGLKDFKFAEFKLPIAPLGKSPAGKIAADRHGVLAGETLHVTVDLNETSTRFLTEPLPGFYNVNELLLVRQRAADQTEIVARLPFGDGQIGGLFAYVAPDALLASELSVFVVTRALPFEPLKLELAALRDIVIEQQPASAESGVGGTASFSVQVPAADAAKYSFQWRRDGVAIAGATTAAYTTPALTVGDSGAVYTATVSNDVGSRVSREAYLTVNAVPAPVIVAAPVDAEVVEGDTASFSVSASSALPLTYQWWRGGSAIAGANGASYTTPPVAREDDGTVYAVSVRDSAGGSAAAAAQLTVLSGPTLRAQPSDKTVFVRKDGQPTPPGATWAAVATGSAPLTYRYYRNGVEIGVSENLASRTSVIWGTGPLSAADTGTKYWYTATNRIGTVKSREATVTTLPELF